MSKLIMVVVLVGSLVAGTVPATAQVQGGIGDPNTLAASGVLVPFFLSGIVGTVATLQVASPVGNNLDAHMFFYRANCQKIDVSVGTPLTTNDIAFTQIADVLPPFAPANTDGLLALAKASQDGFKLVPLDNPVHARMYQFSAVDGRSRVIEPIIINTAEFPSVQHWWSPLRSGATFFAPLQTATIKTDLLLFCPLSTIQGAAGAAFGQDQGGGSGEFTFTDTGFPQINPRFPASALANNIRVRIYNTNEFFKRDLLITCTCNTPFVAIGDSINPFYADARVGEADLGTYTELTSVPAGAALNAGPRVTFTGYTSTFTVNSATNAFFARIQNGSQLSIDGPAVVSHR